MHKGSASCSRHGQWHPHPQDGLDADIGRRKFRRGACQPHQPWSCKQQWGRRHLWSAAPKLKRPESVDAEGSNNPSNPYVAINQTDEVLMVKLNSIYKQLAEIITSDTGIMLSLQEEPPLIVYKAKKGKNTEPRMILSTQSPEPLLKGNSLTITSKNDQLRTASN